ncbi:NACHT domain-containing protein [Actinokineospora sp. UTMC 2448]|uniref:NACHT domain-containing protein n=1 Tax=Actinokineospora sp. UTMC 2448 TaxID=2268449 RepID=UPI0021645B56|nr:NACHT domain-containing protein [Actinokineospora sp. UTMC 2448]UVS77449.1 putative NTPase (NACHT family) [Actinokineospora sp. UTMC 2448]
MEPDRIVANHIDGAIHGPAVQARDVHGGIHIHYAQRPPAVAHTPPADWCALPTPPAEVRSLLQAQVSAAQEMPYRLPGARRPSLDTVYVRQDLGHGSEEKSTHQHRPEPILDARGHLTESPRTPVIRLTVRPPARTVRKALDDDDNLIVTGGPGQGKSTLSLRLAADIAARWLASSDEEPLTEPVLPLRLTARELATRLTLPFSEALAESARAEYGALLACHPTAATLGDRVVGCRWLLLVDGLDEVADATERDHLVRVLAGWATPDSPYRLVLTTRPIEGASLAPVQRIGAARYELQPFDEEALRRFATNWFTEEPAAARFLRQVRAAHLDELVRVPLLATIAAIVFERTDNRPLPDNQYELYESYLKFLRSGHTVRSAFQPFWDPLLEHLGRVRLEADTSLTTAAQEWVREHVPDLPADWTEELSTYLTAAGPLVRRAGDLRFLHHSFAEHLAATAEARLLPDHFDADHPAFARLLHVARVPERGRHARAVLLHHTHLHPTEADRLVGWLHSGWAEEHLLAARLLAWHIPASAEAMTAFLATVRDWAMTAQHQAGEILAEASRAAHHSGLAGWLLDLMRDDAAPWRSRVEAAAALATRLRGTEAAEALSLLRSVTTDTTIAVADRLAAAEALSECGGDEQEVAERGLLSVLDDSRATAATSRPAAVVLAGLGPNGRAHAVAALDAIIDDPWSPDDWCVEAATGLIEIGVEHQDRAIAVFRRVLTTRTSMQAGVREAAIGLASVGPQQTTEAVNALTDLADNRRKDYWVRIAACDALAELGPGPRSAAIDRLLALSREFGLQPVDRHRCARSLAALGLHAQALELLRITALARSARAIYHLYWVTTITAELSPEHQAKVNDLIDQLLADQQFWVPIPSAWGTLAALGGPRGQQSVDLLTRLLSDRSARTSDRLSAASALAALGPEFHAEVSQHLQEIAESGRSPGDRWTAWQRLRELRPELRGRASAELLALLEPHEVDSWEASGQDHTYHRDDSDAMAEAALHDLDSADRCTSARFNAFQRLVHRGPRFHQAAVGAICELLVSLVFPIRSLTFLTSASDGLGPAARGKLADALRQVAQRPEVTEREMHLLAAALAELDIPSSDDQAQLVPELDLAVSAHLSDYWWEERVRERVRLDAGTLPVVRALMADTDLPRHAREVCAMIVAEACPAQRRAAVGELADQADDEFLGFTWRIEVIIRLVTLDSGGIDHARAVMTDERQAIAARAEAASRVGRLAPETRDTAVAILRRLIQDPAHTGAERQRALRWLSVLHAFDRVDLTQMKVALLRDPTVPAENRSLLARSLSGIEEFEAHRALLADSTAPLRSRVAGVSEWRNRRLAVEAEQVLREALVAPETVPSERVEAAVLLSELSPRFAEDAATMLTGPRARIARAGLGRAYRQGVLTELHRIVTDSAWRPRVTAVRQLLEISPLPADEVTDSLRELCADPRLSDRDLVGTRYALRARDGLAPVRKLLDRPRAATRVAAAKVLADHSGPDRAAGARVLDAVATDRTGLPALRWWAADDLMRFGERGREWGAAALRALIDDEDVPMGTRVKAARSLARHRPDLRGGLVRWLRRIRTDNPLLRVQVLACVALFEPYEGAIALHDLARDAALPPGVRLRAATAMLDAHRDYREQAAVVARDVARDSAVPRHIRVKAARALARWSAVGRGEARALLVELNQ